eukprot:2571452-Prymnesium_polylepis.1
MAVQLQLTVLDLALEPSVQPAAVRITCELPGTALRGRTVPMRPDDMGLLAMNELFEVVLVAPDVASDVLAANEAGRALQSALQSDDDEDSDVFLVVHGVPLGAAGGSDASPAAASEAAEIGVAHVNLRASAGGGDDEDDRTLEIFDGADRVVGALSVSLGAVRALRQLLEVQRPALRAPPALHAPDDDGALHFAVGDVQLWPAASSRTGRLMAAEGEAYVSAELYAWAQPDGQVESPSVWLSGASARFD